MPPLYTAILENFLIEIIMNKKLEFFRYSDLLQSLSGLPFQPTGDTVDDECQQSNFRDDWPASVQVSVNIQL